MGTYGINVQIRNTKSEIGTDSLQLSYNIT